MLFLGRVSGQLGWTPWSEGFLLFVSWFIPIHTRMSHPLVMGHYGGREYKDYCLGSLCHISKTLHMCTTPQQHCGISLRHEQGYNAVMLVAKLGLERVLVDRTILGIDNSVFLDKLKLLFPPLRVAILTTMKDSKVGPSAQAKLLMAPLANFRTETIYAIDFQRPATSLQI